MDEIIRAEGISKTYDTGTSKVSALKNVDFAVARGEMVAVMGPSGCGKTTLLNSLSGLDTVDAGTIQLEGQDLAKMGDRARTDYRARRMGFVFQVYNLLPVLSRGRERRAAAAGLRRQTEGRTRAGARRPRHRRPWGVGKAPTGRTLRRTTPAGDDRPGAGQRPGHHLGGRTHRCAGLQDRRRDHGADAVAKPEQGRHIRDRHPRPRRRCPVRPHRPDAGRQSSSRTPARLSVQPP